MKSTGNFGSLVWRAENPYEAILIDIPRQVAIKIGDTVVTGGRSTIFPEDILVGQVRDYKLADNADYYELTVSLFNDMTALRHVYVIEDVDALEIQNLKKP